MRVGGERFSGALARQRRQRIRLTIDELASMVGVTEVAVSAWERGVSTPTPRHLAALAESLGTATADLCVDSPRDLTSLRVLAGYSRTVAAQAADISASTLARYERGGFIPRAEAVAKLAELYGVDEAEVRAASDRTIARREQRAALRRAEKP